MAEDLFALAREFVRLENLVREREMELQRARQGLGEAKRQLEEVRTRMVARTGNGDGETPEELALPDPDGSSLTEQLRHHMATQVAAGHGRLFQVRELTTHFHPGLEDADPEEFRRESRRMSARLHNLKGRGVRLVSRGSYEYTGEEPQGGSSSAAALESEGSRNG